METKQLLHGNVKIDIIEHNFKNLKLFMTWTLLNKVIDYIQTKMLWNTILKIQLFNWN